MTQNRETTFQPLTEAATGPAAVLILCEHASDTIPAEFDDLHLSEEARHSHVAWDPGALPLAQLLKDRLNGALVAGSVSRLLYDCNRPPEAPDAIPSKSEIFDVPGNRDLAPNQREKRVGRIYRPFCDAVDNAIAATSPIAVITVHSFTPVFFGKRRDVEIGILHDADSRLADSVLGHLATCPMKVGRNDPYGPDDGVTHSLKVHAISRGLPNVMIEVRNDLITDAAGVEKVGEILVKALNAALLDIRVSQAEAG